MSGLDPDVAIPIDFTGMRPGEKLHEELMTEEEEQTQRAHNRILVAESPAPPADLQRKARRAAEAGRRGRAGGAAARHAGAGAELPDAGGRHRRHGRHVAPARRHPRAGSPGRLDQDGTQPASFPVPPGRA